MAEDKAAGASKVKESDAWDVVMLESKEKAWDEKTGNEKALTLLIIFIKVTLVFGLLYIFIVSLNMMGNAFKILGGKTAGETFRNAEIFNNPFAGLVLGILATVLVQSSSTSTSIIITMTAAGLIKVDNAIPMIMGANIGTSVTNTIVSLGHAGNRDEYRRAFAGATVHDSFNILTVIILLPVEAITNMLRHIAGAIVDATLEDDQEKGQKQDFLKVITKPITGRIVSVDKKLVTKVAQAATPEELEKLLEKSIIKQSRTNDNHLFMDTPLSDDAAGWVLLIASLMLLSTSLALLVKLLQSIFRGRAAIWMQSLLNLEFKVPYVGDYVLLLFGIAITILFQSSSITTSTLTPLVGVGLIKLDKMLPFTVGANIGTTLTGILAALASSNMKTAMTVALAHFFFNIIGTLIWFPILRMRSVPLAMSKFLGGLAADLAWFPVAYIFVVFVLVPLLLFAISLAGVAAFAVFGSIFLVMVITLIVVLYLRSTRPDRLPASLSRDPAWLPASLRVEKQSGEESAQSSRAALDADLDKENLWWQAPSAWGCVWICLLTLLASVPNGQWANMKYAKFDPREHVGIGAWSACSAIYKTDMAWASAPGCTAENAAACWGWKMEKCGEDGFSDIAGANSNYEKSWENCTAHFQCTPAQWQTACLGTNCGGSGHEGQCKNLTEAVSKNLDKFAVSYVQEGTAWKKGETPCRPLSEVCDNAGPIGTAGSLAWVGFVFALIGQLLMLIYQAMRKSRDMSKALVASAGAFILAWAMILGSWATFTAALNGDATCTIVDVSTRKAVEVTGKFSDIVEGSSYSYRFTVGAWCLLTVALGLVLQRVLHDRAHPWTNHASGKAEADSKVDPCSA